MFTITILWGLIKLIFGVYGGVSIVKYFMEKFETEVTPGDYFMSLPSYPGDPGVC